MFATMLHFKSKPMKKFLPGILTVLIALTSCDNDPPSAENEEEVINKVTLTFTSSSGSVAFSWFDPDGEGTQPPQIDDVVLDSETVYEMSLSLENTLEGEDITEEVESEADHRNRHDVGGRR